MIRARAVNVGPVRKRPVAHEIQAEEVMRRCFFFALLLAGALRCEARYSGGSGTTDDPYLISTAEDMVDLAHTLDDWWLCFRQTADIDLGETTARAVVMIGTEEMPFGGIFDGGGHAIANFTCTYEGANGVGLFGVVRNYSAEIRNVVLLDPNVSAPAVEYVGALVGRVRNGSVNNCHVRRACVTGHMGVGGLVGWNQGAIANCSATGVVSGALSVGGLLGVTFWGEDVTDCWAEAVVTGDKRVGGFAGNCSLASIHWCCAAGKAEGQIDVGGFLGCGEGGVVTNSYTTAAATGSMYVGGFVGRNDLSCNCSAGALPSETIQCYATGAVTGESLSGGLVGSNHESIVQRCFWDIETSGLATSDGGTGLPTAQLQQAQTFMDAFWDFSIRANSLHFWIIRAEPGYPRFGWQTIPGDLDNDGDVDVCDFCGLAHDWSHADTSFWSGGSDLTGDGRVGYADLATFSQHWLHGCRPGADTPTAARR